MRSKSCQGNIRDVLLLQKTLQQTAVAFGKVNNANVGTEIMNVLNNIPGSGFTQTEVILIHTELLYQTDKRAYGERIVLSTYHEFNGGILFLLEVLLQKVCLSQNLSGVSKEFQTFICNFNTVIRAVEQFYVYFRLKFLNGGGNRRLSNK